MADKILRRIVAKGKTRRAGKQSDAYRWLHKRHAPLAAALASDPPEWRTIAEELSDAGVTGGKAKRLTDRAVKRMWQRVCRDVATEASKRAAAVSSANRSHAPASWRPALQPVQSAKPTSETVSTCAGPGISANAAETLARLRRTIDERSGRKRT